MKISLDQTEQKGPKRQAFNMRNMGGSPTLR